jgi:fibronectin-binding autotransporter adhesin
LKDGAKLNLSGNTNWTADLLSTGTGAEITNDGNFTTSFDGLLAHNQGGTRAVFKNHGSFTKSNGNGGETEIQARFENDGTVNVNAGKLHLTGGGKNGANAAIIIAAAAELDIDSDLELLANSTLHGNGIGRLLSGILTAHGLIGIKNFIFENGGLAGSNTFSGSVDWNGGDWNSSIAGATTTIASGGTLNLRSSSTHEFNNRSILNQGVVNWYSGNLRGGNGSVFTNDFAFNDLNGGNKIFLSPGSFGGAASFNNNGTYTKSIGGTTTFQVPFINNGGLLINAGTVIFAAAFTNNGRINLTNGAMVQFAEPLVVNAGTPLGGTGTISAPSVTVGGLLSPGNSPGSLNITGNLNLLAASTLLIELAGTTQGSGYDFVNVGGSATLGGTLAVQFGSGFQFGIQPTDTFTVLTASGAG